jgi:hypothetical protein
MISHNFFNKFPKDGSSLKDLLNWFIIGYKNMYQHCAKKNRYYSGSIEIGFCGLELTEISKTHIEISLIHTGSWGIETFEQVSISVPTKFKVQSHDSFFVHTDSLNGIANLTQQIKENSIFSNMLSQEITGHQIYFGEHDG